MSAPSGKYGAIDVAKLLLALTVAIEHCNPNFPTCFGKWVQWTVFVTAVPYFFLSVGFFLQRSLSVNPEEENEVLRVRFLKAAGMMTLWLLIYLPLAVADAWIDDLPWQRDLTNYLFNVVIHGEPTWGWPLWFVYAMMVGVGLVWLWRSRRWPTWILWLVGVAALLYTDCYDVLRLDSVLGNRVGYYLLLICGHTLAGLLPILTGMWLYEHRIRLAPIWVIGVALVIVAPFAFHRLPVARIALAVLLFALTVRLAVPNTRLTDRMRRHSRWIYFVHIIFVFLAVALTSTGCIVGYSNFAIMTAVIVATICTSLAIELISSRRRHRRTEGIRSES